MSNYSIGTRIRELRTKKHLSQERIALSAGITTAYLGQIEREEKNPTVKLVEKISTALGLSLSELFSDQSINPDTDEILENIIFEMRKLSKNEKNIMLEIIRRIIKLREI